MIISLLGKQADTLFTRVCTTALQQFGIPAKHVCVNYHCVNGSGLILYVFLV